MTKKYTVFVLLSIAFIAPIAYFFLRGDENILNYPPKNQTVVVFGDSLVEGVGATPGNDFVSVLGRGLRIEIINKGKSGDTTASALERTADVSALEPGVVIILLGGNDVLRRIPKKETFKNLENMIKKFQSEGSAVILLGVQGGILFDGYEKDYKDLAGKHRAAYVSNVLDNLITDREYMSDGIHPNDKGYAVIAGRVKPVLEKLLR